ncbi:MAG: SagB/ThcOx family dehydrogenase [Candidatus Sumerlaeaceae bacterium]|nr:SagB/ThcOx family dehydrogenase [Candidatus Sumerlaeaceae bacterium]
MKRRCVHLLCGVFAAFALAFAAHAGADQTMMTTDSQTARVVLPAPDTTGTRTVESVIASRRSRREFTGEPVSTATAGQLLWSAQGITGAGMLRAAPSAGATYPLETYLVAGAVEGLAPGLYRYLPQGHRLELVKAGDLRREIAAAALSQQWIADAPVIVAISAVYERTAARYGRQRATRYVDMEAGHAAQNLYLQAEALGLGTCSVGAFDDSRVRTVLGLPPQETPLLLLPVGKTP